MLQQRMGGQHPIVRLHNTRGDLRGGVDAEVELTLLRKVNGQPLEEEGPEARAGAAADGVEDEEALQAVALICQLTDAVEGLVHQLLAHGVVASRVVIGGVFLPVDHLLGVEEFAVFASADLVDH